MQLWLDERPNWPHAIDNRALFFNAKGGRLTARAVGGIISTIAQTAGLDDLTTAHALRHTLATTLVRGKSDLAVVTEILVTPEGKTGLVRWAGHRRAHPARPVEGPEPGRARRCCGRSAGTGRRSRR
ncbi:tyrosine-type recombinase/integrase [Nonomuraea sp. NPDC049028]|uniref:tyrosine-type recombinase/integrase n=1 Tax=Nonomuraea sp. NPDC049028 TaxID=3364348 RepID=UPI00371C7B6A